jgi:hypothetical protein
MIILQFIVNWRKKSIFGHRTIVEVWFWPLNAKTRNLWPSNSWNRSSLAIRRFCKVVSLIWLPRGGGPTYQPHVSSLSYPLPPLSLLLSPLSASITPSPAPPSDGGARARSVSGADPRGSSISLARRRCPRGELKLPAGPAAELEPFVGCCRCRETRQGRGVRRTSSKLWEEESRRHLRR